MKKKILLTATAFALFVTGCAEKNLNTTNKDGIAIGDGNTNIYENVDPMGQGVNQGNGAYGTGNGTTGTGNSIYGNEEGTYANAGVQNIYFAADQYHITSEKLGQISHNVKLLRTSGKVKLEGHCDRSGTDEYNYALGLRRAKATKDALKANGMSATKITLVSMGESAPECTRSSSADCYSKNRRVEFKVLR